MDAESQENCYQILGVQPRASQEVIDIAYRRLVRIHTSESLDDAALVAGPESTDPFLARVERAYRLLSDPLQRHRHDEELKGIQVFPLTKEEVAEARKRFQPAGAWLAYQRRGNGFLYVRVGWAANFTFTRESLLARVPESGRSYNPRLNEWRIDAQYEDELADIFDNFERLDEPPPLPQVGPTYPRKTFTPAVHRIRLSWQGWPFLIIGGLLVATIAARLFPANSTNPATVQATAAAISLINSFEPLARNLPTATPLPPTPMIILSGTLQYPAVNLRARPGPEAPLLTVLNRAQTYQVIGRLEDSSWYVVASGDETGWLAGWTIAVDGEPAGLHVYTIEQPLPQAILTPIAVADESQ